MQIDRSNYEIWFIDWLDGELTGSQAGQLRVFLDQNPDLREELNDLIPFKAESEGMSYRNKEHLKRQPHEISRPQFEYLCASYLENDLNEIQKEEVEEIASTCPDLKKTFDLMQKTIIRPAKIVYPHKKLILRKTREQKIIYLTVTGLGAAAIISLFLIVYPGIRGIRSLKTDNPPVQTLTENSRPPAPPSPENEKAATVKKADVPLRKTLDEPAVRAKESITGESTPRNILPGSQTGTIDKNETAINRVPVNRPITIIKANPGNSLVDPGQAVMAAADADEAGQSGSSVSKLFREKLLKKKNPGESPLKGYEIAEAGVAGLNKILGWEMALNMSTDETGLPKSVYFRSKILKLQAPVKKREDVP